MSKFLITFEVEDGLRTSLENQIKDLNISDHYPVIVTVKI